MGTMKNTKAAKAAKPETIKSLQDLTAPVKPENPTSPVPPADQPEEAAQPAAPEQPATRQMTDEEFAEFMGMATGRPDLVKAIMVAAANADGEPAKEAEPAKEQIDLEQLKAIVALVTAGKAEHVNAEVVEDDDEGDDDEFEDEYIWNPDPAWETAGWVLGGAALVGLGVLIGYLVTK